MAASNQALRREDVLANPEPSTHGTYRVSFEGAKQTGSRSLRTAADDPGLSSAVR
jgi:hypothetical protein